MFYKLKQLSSLLGKLELRVMNELWRRGESSVADVHRAFGEEQAYTTLMTTLDRLYRKDFLVRRKEGRAFLYTPSFSREGLEQKFKENLIDNLLGGNKVEPVLSFLVDKVSEQDHALLDELDRLVKEKREALNPKA